MAITRTPIKGERRAAIEMDLMAGMPQRATAKKHGVAKVTIQRIHKQLTQRLDKTDFEIKRDAFLNAYAELGVATMEMLTAQARLLKDPDYLSKKSTEDVIKHTQFIRDTFARFEARHSPVVAPDALPERSEPDEPDDEEAVEAELIDG